MNVLFMTIGKMDNVEEHTMHIGLQRMEVVKYIRLKRNYWMSEKSS